MTRRGRCARAALLTAAVVLGCGVGPARAGGWLTSYKEAIEQARKSDRVVLADFTGSDWCGWCIKLKKEVFDTAEFKAWADRNVVLLDVDFPQGKAQSDALKKQNKQLSDKFNIEGFPTIVFLDSRGEELGRSGYLPGGPAAWIKNAQTIIDTAQPRLKSKNSLVAGLAEAKKDNLPLLLLVANDQGEKLAEPLAKDPGFVRYANMRLTVVCLKAVPSAPGEAKALGDLKKKHELKDSPFLLAALDVAADKVVYSTDSPPPPATLIEELEKALPPIPYDGGWTENYEKARLIAAQRKRAMMLNFTGSDWCPWCVRLDQEIFSTDAFKQYAKENLVLVKLDFPKKKELPSEIRQQNQALARKHGVQGFPTLIVLASDGKKLGQMGYMKGGPEPFLAKLKETVK